MIELRDVLEILIGALAGYSIKWIFVVRSHRQTITQQGNVVGGNLAGRDVTTGKDRKD